MNAKYHQFINCKGELLSLDTPKVMGILNVTPDSFFDGGKHNNIKQALLQTEQMLSEGAEIIDIGGYSTRPGAEDIPLEEEINRTIPVIKEILNHFPESVISIDTFRSKVAEAAINSGAAIVNDISGGELDNEMYNIVSKYNVPYILMHMKGTPQNMKLQTEYNHVFKDIAHYFSKKINQLTELGVNDIILDPGFGFAKTINQNYELFNQLEQFSFLQKPLLVGISRKSMIYKVTGTTSSEALHSTSALNLLALQKGAKILRVHDVKEACEIRTLFLKLQETKN